MVIKPKVRGFICTTAHPEGCKAHVQEQVEYIRNQMAQAGEGPKNVLVIGCSTGYGLASRIACAFGFGANTLGVMFEKAPTEKRTASAGWYNTQAMEKFARDESLYAETLNLDAFSHEAKQEAIAKIKASMGKVDLVVYSLASPRRKDPDSGVVYASTLKPVGQAVTQKSLDTDKKVVFDVTIEPASEQEIADTVKVMGGEDWELWIDALSQADVLAEECKTVAFSYIGKAITWPIYGHASIGKAKEDLDRAAASINTKLQESVGGEANVAILKAIVTQSSSAIPVMPLYISLLYKVMKENKVHEDCVEQVKQLLVQHLYGEGKPELDEKQRIRVDLKELDDSIQSKVEALWDEADTGNLDQVSDFEGYQADFFKLFGFGFEHIDYDADVDPRVIPF